MVAIAIGISHHLPHHREAARQPVSPPARVLAAAKHVFGPRWRVAVCVAHYESTDGRHLRNGRMLGPFQVDVVAHPWVNRRRVVKDFGYAARVAYRISDNGRDWTAWSTHTFCGV